jgi:hypothetical protein
MLSANGASNNRPSATVRHVDAALEGAAIKVAK